jgi:hypothetical protein
MEYTTNLRALWCEADKQGTLAHRTITNEHQLQKNIVALTGRAHHARATLSKSPSRESESAAGSLNESQWIV